MSLKNSGIHGLPKPADGSIVYLQAVTSAATNGNYVLWDNVILYEGSDLTYIKDSTQGSYVEINKDGVYTCSLSLTFVSAGQGFGIVVDPTDFSVNIGSVPYSKIVALGTSNVANDPVCITGTRYFRAGQKLFVNYGGASLSATTAYMTFQVTKVG